MGELLTAFKNILKIKYNGFVFKYLRITKTVYGIGIDI
jgi:hypothetical protein